MRFCVRSEQREVSFEARVDRIQKYKSWAQAHRILFSAQWHCATPPNNSQASIEPLCRLLYAGGGTAVCVVLLGWGGGGETYRYQASGLKVLRIHRSFCWSTRIMRCVKSSLELFYEFLFDFTSFVWEARKQTLNTNIEVAWSLLK